MAVQELVHKFFSHPCWRDNPQACKSKKCMKPRSAISAQSTARHPFSLQTQVIHHADTAMRISGLKQFKKKKKSKNVFSWNNREKCIYTFSEPSGRFFCSLHREFEWSLSVRGLNIIFIEKHDIHLKILFWKDKGPEFSPRFGKTSNSIKESQNGW